MGLECGTKNARTFVTKYGEALINMQHGPFWEDSSYSDFKNFSLFCRTHWFITLPEEPATGVCTESPPVPLLTLPHRCTNISCYRRYDQFHRPAGRLCSWRSVDWSVGCLLSCSCKYNLLYWWKWLTKVWTRSLVCTWKYVNFEVAKRLQPPARHWHKWKYVYVEVVRRIVPMPDTEANESMYISMSYDNWCYLSRTESYYISCEWLTYILSQSWSVSHSVIYFITNILWPPPPEATSFSSGELSKFGFETTVEVRTANSNFQYYNYQLFFCGAATQRESWPPHSWGF